jgi:hypothetical protein
MPAPQIILDLVQRFSDSRDEYRSGHYNEAQLRREFLDPFFTALGWDLTNQQGYAPQYREVIQEASLTIEGQTKAPDYAFRIGEATKFFVEAKKPAVNIQYDIHPAFQLRRYAWSAHLPLSILTDFEEFAVYDTRIKPNFKDAASVARTFFFRYTDYAEKWDEIAAIFAKASILKGSFDRYVQDNKAKKGTTEVDDDFLSAIERWRELLARNIALRNPQARTERTLNYAVQMTLDRLIFLRICEDRGIEPERQLDELTKTPEIYPRLVNLFIKADQKYNSGLFHFSKEKTQTTDEDTFTLSLAMDDKVLKQIIRDLYYPESPYAFKVIPVEILGQVYEQFLGKVIRLTPAGQAKVEEKPEVRKAGGVYYTPSYIVAYIVQNTVGKLLEGKTPQQAACLRVVDPACGSGSFLLGAYQHLLDWHLNYYLAPENGGPQAFIRGKSPALLPSSDGGFHLTTAEKKRILINNIYGVDIDHQAVEVTKLSLLLKLLEEETGQLSLGVTRILPDLGHNIRCGNSLIGWDYFHGQLLADEEEIRRVNPFDWQQAFPEVFAVGGFDAVIGNPPYIRIQAMREWAAGDADHYKNIYKSASKGNFDIYVIFIERCLQLLSRIGLLGFILPHKFFQAEFAGPIREILSEGKHLRHIVHFGSNQVFCNATTYTCLLFLSKTPNERFEFIKVNKLDGEPYILNDLAPKAIRFDHLITTLDHPELGEGEWHFSATGAEKILSKLYLQPMKLGDLTEKIFQGIATSADSIFVLKVISQTNDLIRCFSPELNEEVLIERGITKPFLMGKDVHRYEPLNPSNIILFPYQITKTSSRIIEPYELRTNFPSAWAYLVRNKTKLSAREHGKYAGNYFYAFSRPQNMIEYQNPKILSPDIALGSQMTYDENGDFYHTTTVYSFVFKNIQEEAPKYWLGLLNSSLLWYFIKSTGNALRGGYFRFKTNYLNPFPVVTIDFTDPRQVEMHDQMVALVEKMLKLKNEKPGTPQDATFIRQDIINTDKAIDELTFNLYGLSSIDVEMIRMNK